MSFVLICENKIISMASGHLMQVKLFELNFFIRTVSA